MFLVILGVIIILLFLLRIIQGNMKYGEIAPFNGEKCLTEEEYTDMYFSSDEWLHYCKYYLPAFLGIPIGLIFICSGINMYFGGISLAFFSGCFFTIFFLTKY